MKSAAMLDTYPATMNVSRVHVAEVIDNLVDCSQACTACADACLSEPTVADLTKCVRTTLDCADVCDAGARILSRHTGYDANITRAQLAACVAACRACQDECARHADLYEHCRICAEACTACADACAELLDAIR